MKIQNVFRTALIGTLGVGVGLLLWGVVQSLTGVITYVGAALFIAMGLNPLIAWLESKKIPRWAALILVIIAFAGIITGFSFLIVPLIIEQVPNLTKGVENYFNDGDGFSNLLNKIHEIFPALDVTLIGDSVIKFVNDLVANPDNIFGIGSQVLTVGVAVANALFGGFIIFILTIYFAASLNGMKQFFYQMVPASKRDRVSQLTEKITASVGGYVTGLVTLASLSAVLSYIFLSIIGAPYAIVMAAIGFFFTMIPLVGTVTGSTIIVLTTLMLGNPTLAIIAAVYYFVFYMNFEAYFVSPRIMNRAVQVPGAVVVIAALSGGALLGLMGALIAIPVAASVMIILREVVIPKQDTL